jgi:hypothetical protein
MDMEKKKMACAMINTMRLSMDIYLTRVEQREA